MEELSPLMRLMYSHQPSESPDHRPAPATASGGNSNNPYNQELNELLPTAEHQQLYTQLGYEPTSIDTLVERSQLTTETVSAMLVELELKGCVTSTSGLYSRAH
jgi:predicted Rossmann fold nucleotide-binding protein DprA/Smf involved in DNA uptake